MWIPASTSTQNESYGGIITPIILVRPVRMPLTSRLRRQTSCRAASRTRWTCVLRAPKRSVLPQNAGSGAIETLAAFATSFKTGCGRTGRWSLPLFPSGDRCCAILAMIHQIGGGDNSTGDKFCPPDDAQLLRNCRKSVVKVVVGVGYVSTKPIASGAGTSLTTSRTKGIRHGIELVVARTTSVTSFRSIP